MREIYNVNYANKICSLFRNTDLVRAVGMFVVITCGDGRLEPNSPHSVPSRPPLLFVGSAFNEHVGARLSEISKSSEF